MKSDLDQLMEMHRVDALLVTGPANHNPFMVYFTGVCGIMDGDLIKKKGEPPILFHAAMERDEAALTGLKTISYSKYPLRDLLKSTGGKFFAAQALRYQRMLADAGITEGRVALYGLTNLGPAWATFTRLRRLAPGIRLVGEESNALLLQAMQTKDPDELTHIQHIGRIAVSVMERVRTLLTTSRVKDNTLFKPDGQPLTVGDVKRQIDLWLVESGAENPEGTIFAIGKDGATPHSTGNPAQPIRLGEPIVFDFFPCEAGGGYFYDITRTWCLGYAPPEVQKLYDQVRAVYSRVTEDMEMGAPCGAIQHMADELFEGQGHPTTRKEPSTERGFVHGLGHGVGLHIHEKPWFNRVDSPDDRLLPGTVFTIEPGLYYPEQNMGVRLEDTYWVRPDGVVEKLADYPLDLILPISS